MRLLVILAFAATSLAQSPKNIILLIGDGMGPRTHYIRSQWIWHNDGQSLEATLRPQPE